MPRIVAILFLSLVLASGCKHTKSIAYTNEKYTTDESQFMDLMGMKVHYRIEGEGKPLVLVHGIGGFLQMWGGWTEELKENYQIIRMDMPMSGLTGPIAELPSNPNMDIFVHFLKSFLDKLEIENFHLVGNSLGGWIAWEYALAYPEDIDRLVLIDAAGLLEIQDGPKAIKLSRKKIANVFLKSGIPKIFVKNFYKGAYGDKKEVTDKQVTTYYDLLNREGNLKAFYELSRLDIPIDKERVNQINIPTLIMWGEKDRWIGVKYAHEFHERIKGSQLKIYPELGHTPMEESPKETAVFAKSFLSSSLEE